jgi:hypothetical protein
MRRAAGFAAILVFAVAPASGQVPSPSASTDGADAKPRWAFSLSAHVYVVPHQQDYAQPTIAADYDWLHLEARYNYEALESGSGWIGYNFAGRDVVAWAITPMIGGVVGNTSGVATGYRGSVQWWLLELFSEGEYVFDTRHSAGNFFYSWSELALRPVAWARVGLAEQRTLAYKSDHDRGMTERCGSWSP